MTYRQVFAQLRGVLAELYGDPDSARRMAQDAGLDVRQIPFSARAIDNWHAILQEAEHQRRVNALLDNALREYSEPKLQDARRAYDAWVADGRPGQGDIVELSPSGLRVSLAKLPSTDAYLVGREKELALLDAAWSHPPLSTTGEGKTNVLTLVAWGGVGKSALVNQWLAQMARQNYSGAERVYGWSFYSQGAAEGRQVSADPFIAAALKWFGDPDPTQGSPWDKGERLAELVKRQRTLLILDGLEPLQTPPQGDIKDHGLKALLRELARQNPGLVVITTRLAVDDLKDFVIASPEPPDGGRWAKQSPCHEEEIASAFGLAMTGASCLQLDLENLSTEAGAAYLAHLGVQGTPAELAHAAEEFGGHALALTLLGKYLATVHRGDVRKRDQIARLTDERRQGAHARRVMAAYESWFKGKPELDILRLMGLFDRPAEGGALDALRKKPAIKGLTERVQKLSHADWQYAVENLRTARLVAAPDPHDPEALDCHPLLREHFADQLRAGDPKAWREAHSRLYEYYKSRAKELPDTIEEMTPLYVAVAHGCQAGRHQEALIAVYWKRIRRGEEAFSVKKLGAFGADLAALSGFFDPPWRKVVDGLKEADKGFVLNAVGFHLRALGRLAEAAQPLQAGLDAAIAQKSRWNAAQAAGNLSELYLTLGDVQHALDTARQSVELADRSGEWDWRMISRTTLADALHQAGQLAEAEAAFREAEEMQKASQIEFPLLYSLQGFRYCDLLLSQGKVAEVQSRAGQMLEEGIQAGDPLLDIALYHLSLGRAHLLQAQQAPERSGAGETLKVCTTYLDRAVDGLRQAGTQHHLPRGLLARAELRRAMGALDTGELDKARQDLDEALSIATRGGMRLHEADCHLAYARLHLAEYNLAKVSNLRKAEEANDKASESLAKAKQIIEQIGYHRRDQEVEELEGQL